MSVNAYIYLSECSKWEEMGEARKEERAAEAALLRRIIAKSISKLSSCNDPSLESVHIHYNSV
mgnify:CR=1 FL=1